MGMEIVKDLDALREECDVLNDTRNSPKKRKRWVHGRLTLSRKKEPPLHMRGS
jgi:hypothetical protein